MKNLPNAASDYDKAANLLQRSSIPEKKLNRILQRAQEAALDSGSVKQKDKRLEVLEELGKLYFTAKTDIFPKDQVKTYKIQAILHVNNNFFYYFSPFMMKCLL